MSIELTASAKVNLALEVLARRDDGYHEIATIMQTIDLADTVRLSEAASIDLVLEGDEILGVPVEGPRNLAYKAAVELAAEAGRSDLGARIELEKHIPAGMGLGGGSSDAAAVLRGLNRFWRLDYGPEVLESVAARVGSDVVFFVRGGTALVTGRGEKIEPLPDIAALEFTLFTSPVELDDKTRRMYSLLTPSDFTDGRKVHVAAQSIRRGLPLAEVEYANAFSRHIAEVAPPMAHAMQHCRDAGLQVLACGSGPGFFTPAPLAEIPSLVLHHLEREWDVTAQARRTLAAGPATAMREI